MASQNLRFEREDQTAVLTLNRPERRNALSVGLMEELIQCLEAIGRDPAIRAVILAATGKVFCSGHDLTEMLRRTEAEYRRIFQICTELMRKLQTIPQPVIAQVQGRATAAGCQLVAACDLAVASEQASFATPGVSIGLFCTTPMVALTRAISRKRAFYAQIDLDLENAYAYAQEVMTRNALAADAQEGISAFLEKRPPRWAGM